MLSQQRPAGAESPSEPVVPHEQIPILIRLPELIATDGPSSVVSDKRPTDNRRRRRTRRATQDVQPAQAQKSPMARGTSFVSANTIGRLAGGALIIGAVLVIAALIHGDANRQPAPPAPPVPADWTPPSASSEPDDRPLWPPPRAARVPGAGDSFGEIPATGAAGSDTKTVLRPDWKKQRTVDSRNRRAGKRKKY